MPRRRPSLLAKRRKITHKESGGGTSEKRHVGTGEVDHPAWNESNGTERCPRAELGLLPLHPAIATPNSKKAPFEPCDMEATGPRKGVEGMLPRRQAHSFLQSVRQHKGLCGFIFQRRLTTILLPLQRQRAPRPPRTPSNPPEKREIFNSLSVRLEKLKSPAFGRTM